jgi:hypothetical protein
MLDVMAAGDAGDGVRRGSATTRLARALWFGASALCACSRGEPPPDSDARPSQPTLTVAANPAAPTTGRRIVAAAQIAQPWHTGAWSPASITLADVAAGDALVVLGASWGDLVAGSSTAPSDLHGALRRVVDQGSSIVGRKKPPVFAQLYVEFDAAPGPHTIVPPYLGGAAGDGTLYVLQIRGLTERRVITIGQSWATGAAMRTAEVALDRDAAPDDLLIALGGYDDTAPPDHAGFSHPPAGWQPLGLQDNPTGNVPSELCYRTAGSAHAVTWTWTDPTVNVTAAVIAALR